ncbi:MAG: aminotransferase class I/II-fold pyridoxal phosphate-dependent enzyme [Parachlamydiaceae bacterium]
MRITSGRLRTLPKKSELIDFASNDYLGLSKSMKLVQAVSKEMQLHGQLGSTGSRLISGNHELIEALEQQIAHFHQFESALLFPSGFMANFGLLSSIGDREDAIFFDHYIHPSTHNGIRLSKAAAYSFRHNDVNHLEDRIKRRRGYQNYVCIESLYSTKGTYAPLKAIIEVCKRYQARLIVDEAHTMGLFGKKGEGLIAQQQFQQDVFAVVITYGKACGGSGAAILGSSLLKQYLINFSTTALYSTAPFIPQLCHIKQIYEYLPCLDLERRELQRHTGCFTEPSPIQIVPILDGRKAKSLVHTLASHGFQVSHLRPPTVSAGKDVLRIALHSFNTREEILALQNVLKEV